jgi:outer membrane translocation and assembly module TamA
MLRILVLLPALVLACPSQAARVSVRTPSGERYLFWPTRVPEPGAMRQWGRHATAFVERRYFDDPDLFEKYLEI